MENEFLLASSFNLLINLAYTIISLFVGVISLNIIDKLLLKSINIQSELKNNNIAVSIFASTILLFVALIVSFGLKG